MKRKIFFKKAEVLQFSFKCLFFFFSSFLHEVKKNTFFPPHSLISRFVYNFLQRLTFRRSFFNRFCNHVFARPVRRQFLRGRSLVLFRFSDGKNFFFHWLLCNLSRFLCFCSGSSFCDSFLCSNLRSR